MKKIISLLFIIGCLFMMSSCNYTKEEKQILKEYEELSTSDFNDKYEYLKDENNVFVSIRYEDLMKRLDTDTFILYVGGAWCPNCQASVKFINEAAKELNIDKVYNFDTRISSLKTAEKDIRNWPDYMLISTAERIMKRMEAKKKPGGSDGPNGQGPSFE